MAHTARYSKPLQVVEEPHIWARILKISNDERCSIASVIRQCIRHSLDWREEISRNRMTQVREYASLSE